MATYGTRYIYKGFLIWIIPSTYRSRMAISQLFSWERQATSMISWV